MFPFFNAFSQGINFKKISFEKALIEAEQTNKLVFIDFYTVWCRPCKVMDKEVFPLKDVGDVFNTDFISLKVNAESEKGKVIAKKYNVNAYPTFLYVNHKGTVVHKLTGGMSSKSFITEAEIATGKETLFTLKKTYASGERNPDFILKYLKALANAGEADQAAEDEFMTNMSKAQLLTEEIFDLIYRLSTSIDGGGYKNLMTYKEDYIKLKNKELVDLAINTIQARQIYTNVSSLDVFESSLNKVKAINPDIARTIGCAGYVYLKEQKKGLLLVLGDGMMSENQDINNLMILYFKRYRTYLNEKEFKRYAPLLVKLSHNLSKESIANLDSYAEILHISGDLINASKMASKVLKEASKESVKSFWSYKFRNDK